MGPLVFLNGSLLPASRASLAIYDRGVTQGATATEQLRTFGQRLFRLGDHLQRLERSLGHLHLDIGMTMAALGDIVEDLVARNARPIPSGDDLGLVIFVTAGEYAPYAGHQVRAGPTVCAHTFPLAFQLWAAAMARGLRLVTPAIRHLPPACHHPAVKSRSRLHFYLADAAARQVDPGAAALLLDVDGKVTETSSANFFMFSAGAIVSPTPRNILPGISRMVVREIAAELDVDFVERDFGVDEAIAAEEAFTSSTPYCLLPVTRINGHAIGNGEPGPVHRRLLQRWSHRVGVDIAAQIRTRAEH